MTDPHQNKIVNSSKKLFRYLKIGIYTLAILLVLTVVGGSLFTYFYKDRIVSFFVSKANERLIVPVAVNKIDVSFFQHFPYTSIVLNEVSIHSPEGFQTKELASIPNVYLTLNPFKIIKGNYEIDKLILEGGQVDLEMNKEGRGNYMIFKKREEGEAGFQSSIGLETKKVTINYLDLRSDKNIGFLSKNVSGTVDVENRNYKTKIDGEVLIYHISLGELVYFENKEIDLNAFLHINDELKFLTIEKGKLGIGKGKFDVDGDVYYGGATKVNLNVKGVETSAQTLISLLPDKYANSLKGYKSKGEIYFEGTVKGEFTDTSYPNSVVNFGAVDAEFYHPDYKKSLENINLTGFLETGTRRDFSQSYLKLNDMNFELDDHVIKGYLNISNFRNPFVESALKGKVDLNALIRSFPDSKIKQAFGEMDLDIEFSGYPKIESGLDAFKVNGEVDLSHVSFVLRGERLPFNQFDGSFIFRENDLAISDFSGLVGKSDFLLNGFFKNISSLFRKEDKNIKIEADLRSSYLDFDELLLSNFASQDTIKKGDYRYSFHISPKIDLNFNCQVDHLRFKRFYGGDISGNLRVTDQIARLNRVTLNTMGGNLTFDGTVNNRLGGVVEIGCMANLKSIYVDSVFYVFHNFDQTWLVDKNLKGQINSTVNTYILLDEHLKFYSDDFTADISASIMNGELLDFEPMQRLSKYVEEESLAHMRFSEVRNDIRIKNKTIYIPKMLVSSSVSNIMVSGTHTFDQRIDYHVAVPLRSFLRIRKLSDQEIEQRSDGSHLLLRIYGNTNDYTIKYDTKEVKKKIVADIKSEGRELKEVFKNKGQTEGEVIQVEDDEYFEFEEDKP